MTKLRRKVFRSNRLMSDDVTGNDVTSDQQQQQRLNISMRDLVVTADALSFTPTSPNNRAYLPSNASPKPVNRNAPHSPDELPSIHHRERSKPGIRRALAATGSGRPRDLFQRPINSSEQQTRGHVAPRDNSADQSNDVGLFDLVIGAPQSSPSLIRKRATTLVKRNKDNKRERVPQNLTREMDFSLDGRQWGGDVA